MFYTWSTAYVDNFQLVVRQKLHASLIFLNMFKSEVNPKIELIALLVVNYTFKRGLPFCSLLP